MKNIFIVNPCAGQGKKINKLVDFIKESCELINADYEVYITKTVGDATDFIRQYINSYGNARFIACGGDGTLSEVINGIIDFSDSEAGVMPIGTGNDFCRNFKTNASYRDAVSQVYGQSVMCDAIKYTTYICDREQIKYSANMINVGFDCNVAHMTAQMKKKPFVSGSMAYYMSIFLKLIKKEGANLKIEIDGVEVHNGPLLLTAMANGRYCGGGVKSNPTADINDGYLDVNIVNNVSRSRFVKLLPHYVNGNYIDLKNIGKVIKTYKCKKITITPLDGLMRICSDGEIFEASKTEFEVIHNAFRFVIPSVEDKRKISVLI